MNRYSYAREKLGVAVETLATGQGDVRSRLLDAFMSFHTLKNDDLPPDLQKDWEWVMKELTKYGAVLDYKGEVWKGSVENTMDKIRRKTGEKIAQKIWNINWEINNNEEYI